LRPVYRPNRYRRKLPRLGPRLNGRRDANTRAWHGLVRRGGIYQGTSAGNERVTGHRLIDDTLWLPA
jgi:hypothetical protein